MNKRYYVLALLICLILLISACKRTGSSTGTAPRTPFIGGTSGLTIDFEKDSPPEEVTDDSTFKFAALVRLRNDGETKVDKEDIKVNLIGFDPSDFGAGISFDALRDQMPEDSLDPKRRDAEGNLIEGTTSFVKFPEGDGDFQVSGRFPGNTEFTFRAEACYLYKTLSNTKICVLKDMFNIADNSLCRPSGSKAIHSSSAPVQVTNFRQSVIGTDKISFTFDIVLSGNVDIFFAFDESDIAATPFINFEEGCPKTPSLRRQKENNVFVEIKEVPDDPIFKRGTINCGGLENDFNGVVRLVNGRRTLTCTVELVPDRLDLEKVIGIEVTYNVLDNKETQVLVKHLATDEATP